MDKAAQYRAMAMTRDQQFHVRIFIAAFIGLSSFFLAPSMWPVIWYGAVLATQIFERQVARWLFVKRTGDIAVPVYGFVVAITALNSAVYVGISAYLWFHGPAGQMFAIMVICGGLLHICLHHNAVRELLVAGVTAQSAYLFGLPFASALLIKQSSPAPLIVMLISGVLYLAHLIVGVRQSHKSHQALKAATDLAEEQRKLAEGASRSKSAFLATISHEIRTPLNAVTSTAHLLGGTRLSSDQAEYVSILLNGSEVLLALINEVLDMSKIEAGKMELEISDVELRGVVDKLSSLWSPKAAERGLRLTVSLDPNLPAGIRCDGLRLTQILFNLVSNAVKFTDKGDVSIMVREVAGLSARDQRRLSFEVIDTGPGMSEQVASRLFQNFEQADAGITRRFGGTGLGLAISRRLAQIMGGELTVDSQPNLGSTFRLEIPLEAATPKVAELVPDVVVADPAEKKALSILVAEDHPVNRRLLELLLGPFGWSLEMAEDGAEAVRAADLRVFDVILMDMQMPILSGLEATRLIRAGAGPNAATPIVALTANAFEDQRGEWLDAGAAAFLTKPINPAALVETILGLVDAAETAPEPVKALFTR